MSRGDGGPAFPRVMSREGGDFGQEHYVGNNGMSLRDWFAGQALAGLLAFDGERPPAEDADSAYLVADAMLERRVGGRP